MDVRILLRMLWQRGVALCALALMLAGCASANAPNIGVGIGAEGGALITPPTQPTPPPFPAFTVGAWIDNMAPEKGAMDRLYVLVRVHNPLMSGPSQPPPAGSVAVSAVHDGVVETTKTTDSDGFAWFDFTASGPPTTPSVVTVTATYQGNQYVTTTFYTVLPDIKGTPSPSPTPHP